MRDHSVTAHTLWPVNANLFSCIPSIDMAGFVEPEQDTASSLQIKLIIFNLHLLYIHMLSKSYFLHYKALCITNIQPKKKKKRVDLC